jgi:2-keto-4-pentenoate hydratase/2-oxohepta-3-ene-1,7-dioic acid hydratase in catechol pathway
MKLAQYYFNDRLQIGLVKDNVLSPVDFDGDMLDFINSGKAITSLSKNHINVKQAILAAPLTRPSKIIAVGLNYKDHARESKGEIPRQPLIFAKFPNTIIGPNQNIAWETNITKKVDFEAELAVIIANKVRNCTETEALASVFGYTCANDVSARDLQFGDRQWVRGKSLDTFCPLGPWIATPDEIPAPHSLNIRCRLNNRLMQDSNTGMMIFNIPTLISFMSRHFTLFPGDIILTGTPHGAGAFKEPSVYMKNGDKVVVEIEGIGQLSNQCVSR